jgi:hypothetical protein
MMSKEKNIWILFGASYLLLAGFFFYIKEIPFVPIIRIFFVKNYFLLFFITSILFFVYWFRQKFIKSLFVKPIFIALHLIFFVNQWFDSGFLYKDFNQSIVRKFGSKTYLIETYDRGFGICNRRYSIEERRGLILKRIYNIGCYDYKIEEKGDNKLLVITTVKNLFKIEKYDSILVMY